MSIIEHILSNFDTQCPFCCEKYDNNIHLPMMMCSAQHACCRYCLHHLLFKGKQKESISCPLCKELFKLQNTKPFRLLNQTQTNVYKIEQYSKQMEGKFIQMNNHKQALSQDLVKQRQDNELLTSNFNKKEQEFINQIQDDSESFSRQIAKNDAKIALLEKQTDSLKELNKKIKADWEIQKRQIKGCQDKISRQQIQMQGRKQRYKKYLFKWKNRSPCCLFLQNFPKEYKALSSRQILTDLWAHSELCRRNRSINQQSLARKQDYSNSIIQQGFKFYLEGLLKNIELHKISIQKQCYQHKFCNVKDLVGGIMLLGLNKQAMLFCTNILILRIYFMFSSYDCCLKYLIASNSHEKVKFPNRKYLLFEQKFSYEQYYLNVFGTQSLFYELDLLQQQPFLTKQTSFPNSPTNLSRIQSKIAYLSYKFAENKNTQLDEDNILLQSLINRLNSHQKTTPGIEISKFVEFQKEIEQVESQKRPNRKFENIMKQMKAKIMKESTQHSMIEQELQSQYKQFISSQEVQKIEIEYIHNKHKNIAQLHQQQSRLHLIIDVEQLLVESNKIRNWAQQKIQFNDEQISMLFTMAQQLIEHVSERMMRSDLQKIFKLDQQKKREGFIRMIQKGNIIPVTNPFLRSFILGNLSYSEGNKSEALNLYYRLLNIGKTIKTPQFKDIRKQQLCNLIIFYLAFLFYPSFQKDVLHFIDDQNCMILHKDKIANQINQNMLIFAKKLEIIQIEIAKIPISQRKKANPICANLQNERVSINLSIENLKERRQNLSYLSEDPQKMLKVLLSDILDKIRRIDEDNKQFIEILFGFFQCRTIQKCPPLVFLDENYMFVGSNSIILQKMRSNKFGYYFDEDYSVALCHFADVHEKIYETIFSKQVEFYSTTSLFTRHERQKTINQQARIISRQYKKKPDAKNLKICLAKCVDKFERNRVLKLYEEDYVNLSKIATIMEEKDKLLMHYYQNYHLKLHMEELHQILSQLRQYQFIKEAYLKLQSFSPTILEDLAEKVEHLQTEYTLILVEKRY